ncbi:late embryogenesis abundant protein At1g64065-like [Typha angustifolia]|uniref:late embryogenesis abundant protein At1g64065-like n=1 Tax=Typha angustifolia TaxID=59011 RepID=UPI003C3071F0
MSKRSIKICSIVTAVVILLVVLLVILYFTVFKPKTPEATASVVNIQHVDFTLVPLTFNLTLAVEIVIKNPNFAGFKYGGSMITIYYHGDVVGSAPINAGMIHARKTETISTSVEILASKVMASSSFRSDVSKGLDFTSSTTIDGKVIILGMFKLHASAKIECTSRVWIFTATSTSTCNSEFKVQK